MKQEELLALGLGEEQTNAILALHDAEVERHKNEAAGLRTRVEEMQGAQGEAAQLRERCRALEAQAAGQAYRHAAEQALEALRFTSKGARGAFERALCDRGLPVGEDGFCEEEYRAFLSEYQADDPGAFEGDAPAPRFVGPTPGAAPSHDPHTQANDALRALLRRE